LPEVEVSGDVFEDVSAGEDRRVVGEEEDAAAEVETAVGERLAIEADFAGIRG
jgi:hypothetical protein